MTYTNDSKKTQGTYLGNDCYIFNENGTMELSVDSEYQKVEITDPRGMHCSDKLIISFQSIEEFRNKREHIYLTKYIYLTELSKSVRIERGGGFFNMKGKYDIQIREKEINSMPSPYTSNCTDANVVSNMFSARYTFDSCQETCAYNYMYKNVTPQLIYGRCIMTHK